jgi:hypothetical protein
MEFFFKRLEKYIQFRPSAAMMDIIVKVMVEVISILGIVTKEIGQGRTSMPLSIYLSQHVDVHAEKYVKKLFGRNEVEDALLRIEKLMPEEALMAAAETMTVTRDIDDTVKDVAKTLGGVNEGVQVVDGRVKGVNRIMKGVDYVVKDVDHVVKGINHRVKAIDSRVNVVDHKVGSVLRGEFFLMSWSSNLCSAFHSVRCNGDWDSHSTNVGTSHRPKLFVIS